MKATLNNKVKDLVGRNPVTPLDKNELWKMNAERCMSPEKLNRVVGIHGSQGMKATLTS